MLKWATLRKQTTHKAITQHETHPAAANGENATRTTSESLGRQQRYARQERQTAKHWDAITRQWQHRKMRKRARTEATEGAVGHKQNAPSQPKITRFMTTTRHAMSHKRGKKRDADSRAQRAQRSKRTMEGDATTETYSENDTEETPTTQNTKRQKTDRTGIG